MDACKHPFKTRQFLFEVAEAGLGQAVNACGASLGGGSCLRLEPSFLEHALKGGVEGAFLDLQQLVGNLLDVLDESIAVHGAEPEGLEDHHLQGAGKEVAMFGVPGHIG